MLEERVIGKAYRKVQQGGHDGNLSLDWNGLGAGADIWISPYSDEDVGLASK